jgi:hypothetical protein
VIEPLRRGERDDLAQFGVTAIYITRSCTLGVGCDLARVGPVAAAWWVGDRCTADQVIMAIGERHPATIEGATREIKLTRPDGEIRDNGQGRTTADASRPITAG